MSCKPTTRSVLITAALTALITSLVSDWGPGVLVHLYQKVTQKPIVIVEVIRGPEVIPVPNVMFTAEDVVSEVSSVYASTDDRGLARLQLPRTASMIHIVARFHEDSRSTNWTYKKIHELTKFPAHISLDIATDFHPNRVEDLRSSVAVESLRIQYDQSALSSDREAVKARLEVDWLEGTSRPSFRADTKDGVIHLEELLKEVGIELEIVWSDELPLNVAGPDGRFSIDELRTAMATYRNKEREHIWNFYFILGSQSQPPGIMSLMFDPRRRGAVLFDMAGTQSILFSAVHEIGHMLNLPHPWQTYGDTYSVMSYPFHWGDRWSFDDPDVYRFDEVGRRHILRSPERYVKPGGSEFLDYGIRQPWITAENPE